MASWGSKKAQTLSVVKEQSARATDNTKDMLGEDKGDSRGQLASISSEVQRQREQTDRQQHWRLSVETTRAESSTEKADACNRAHSEAATVWRKLLSSSI